MVSRNCLCAIIWLFIVGSCNGGSVLTSSSVFSDSVSQQPFFSSTSQINTVIEGGGPNPTLVHGLTSPLTATLHTLPAGRHSSSDYLPLSMPTMSSAYTEINGGRKSVESLVRSEEYPQSTIGVNHLVKQSGSSATLETSSGILPSMPTAYSYSHHETIGDYSLQSSQTPGPFRRSSSLDSHSVFIQDMNSGLGNTINASVTSKVNSITSSSHLSEFSTTTTKSSSHYYKHSSSLHTPTSSYDQQQNSFIQSDSLDASEWDIDVYATFAFEDSRFSELYNSFEIAYDEDSSGYYHQIWPSSSHVYSSSSKYEPKLSSSPSSSGVGVNPLSSQYQRSSVYVHVDSSPSVYYSSHFVSSVPVSHTPVLPNVYAKHRSSISSIPQFTSQIQPSASKQSFIQSSSQYSEMSSQKLPSSKANFIFTSDISSLPESETRETTPHISSSLSPSVQPTESEHASFASSFAVMPTQTQSIDISEIVTPLIPKPTNAGVKDIYKDCRFLFTFSGDCQMVTNNTLYLAEFIEGLRETLVEKLDISNDRIKPHDISCESIKIYVTFKNVSYPKTADVLREAVRSKNFVVPTYIENKVVMFTAETVREVPLRDLEVNSLDLPGQGIDKIDIIVIIVACCICGILLVIGLTVCIKECYKRKYAQSFDLLDMPHVNLKLEDFTLTRIPRPKTTYTSENSSSNHSYPERYNQPKKKENGQSIVTNGNHINLNDVHVRMQPLSDGIVVGVTGYSTPNGTSKKKKRAPSASSNFSQSDTLGNPSTENLVPEPHFTSIGASNPIFVDDDQGSTSTLDVSQAHTGLSE